MDTRNNKDRHFLRQDETPRGLQLNLELIIPLAQQWPLDTFTRHLVEITTSFVPHSETTGAATVQPGGREDKNFVCIVSFVPISRGSTIKEKKRGFIITSNQCVSLITNRHHSKCDVRLCDDGIYYLGHLLAEEKSD